MCRCLIIKLSIQAVTMVTNHDQSYNRQAWMGTYHRVTNPGQTCHLKMQLPNKGPGKLDKLSQNAQAQTGYSRVQCKYALHKRSCRSRIPQTSWAAFNREHLDKLADQKSNFQQHCRRLGKRHKA